jgi:hypothetical protein
MHGYFTIELTCTRKQNILTGRIPKRFYWFGTFADKRGFILVVRCRLCRQIISAAI